MRKLLFTLLLLCSNAFSYPDSCKGYEDEYSWTLGKFTQRNLQGKTIFSGSSSILMWKDTHRYFSTLKKDIWNQNYYNRGFGGSQICHLLIHQRQIFFGSSKSQNPKRIVLYSGDNDLAGGLTIEQIITNYKLLISNLRDGGIAAPIYLIAAKPSPKRMYLVKSIQDLGIAMEDELSDFDGVYVINTFNEFFDEDGNIKMNFFLEDQLHLRPVVYWIWAKKLEKLWK